MVSPENRYLLALDLDGTTCNDQYHIGQRTKDALTAARKAGHIVCFATGRRDIDMLSLGEDYIYADYLVLNNGGKLVHTPTNEVLFNTYVEPEAARALIAYSLENNLQLHVLDGMYWAINKWNDSLEEYVAALGQGPTWYHTLEEVPWQHLEGFMATVDLEPVTAFIREKNLPLRYSLSEPGCVDIMPEGITKWGGLERLMELLNIPSERVIAAGDYDNDLEMIRCAGIGVAVQNAQPVVKEAADYITPHDNNHDAVADIVEKYLTDQF